MTNGYVFEIKKQAKENECFRKVIVTATKSQVVLMSLQPAEEIGMEVHDGDQIIYVVDGEGLAAVGEQEVELDKGSLLVVPAGVQHNVTNIDDKPLKLFTVYAPPQHADGTVHPTRKDAAIAERFAEAIP